VSGWGSEFMKLIGWIRLKAYDKNEKKIILSGIK
jgi:hypothetical protein